MTISSSNDEGHDTTLEPLLPVHHQQSFTINTDGDTNPFQNGISNEQSQLSPSSSPRSTPQAPTSVQQPQQLSFSLRIGYSCFGMIMTLPNTAFLYFINTYQNIPLSLLPLYMSISFLPYSLKPSYAYISSLLEQQSFSFISSSSSSLSFVFTRQIQIICLLIMSGISYIITAYIPSHAIFVSFVLAFIRSITMAWPSFLYDLLLLDEAMVVATSHDNYNNNSNNFVSLLRSNNKQKSSIQHGEIVATFQSQAATYRSIGCVVANIFALLILIVPQQLTFQHYYYHHHQHHNNNNITNNTPFVHGMSHTSFQFILILTGILNFICAMVLWRYGAGGGNSSTSKSSQTNNDSSTGCELEHVVTIHTPLLSKSDTIGDETIGTTHVVVQRRTPSYDSIEDHIQNNNCDLLRHTSLEIDSPDTIGRLMPDQQSNNQTTIESSSSSSIPIDNYDLISHNNNSKWLIVLLQIIIILLTLRESMIHILSNIGWICIILVPIVLLLLLACNMWRTSWQTSTTDAVTNSSSSYHHQQQHSSSMYQLRVGLFLILRYSIPSFTYVMNSYVYTTFETMPYLLQIFSLLDMCTTAIACWTYSQYLSQYSSGQQLLWLIVITTILAGISSLFGNIFLIHILDSQQQSNSSNDNNNNYSISTKIICTIGINTIIGFFNEWKFFSDVVLASISINTPINSSLSTNRSSNDRISDDVVPNDSNNNHHRTNRFSTQQQQQQQHPLSVGVQYGSLMSCIDFGDQMGTLLAGPIIALLHTSRENHWQHLDVLQEINSTFMILSIAFILLLVR